MVTSYDLRPGNRDGLFWFWCLINLPFTFWLRHLPTYVQPRDIHGAQQLACVPFRVGWRRNFNWQKCLLTSDKQQPTTEFDNKKGKGFTYSLPSAGPGAYPGVQAVSPQVTISHPPSSRLSLLSASLRLPSQSHSITAAWPTPSYTAWWQRHIGVNNLPKVVTQLLPGVEFEPTTCWSQVQRSTRCATAPPQIGQ